MLIPTLIAFVLAFLASVALGPLIRRLALRWHLTDGPDGNRKVQKEPVALGGGLVVYLSLAFVAALICGVAPGPGLGSGP